MTRWNYERKISDRNIGDLLQLWFRQVGILIRDDERMATANSIHQLRYEMRRSPTLELALQSLSWSAQARIGIAVMSLFFAMANTSLCAELSLDQLELQYPEQIIPLVQKYCLGCHSAAEMEGELDLERFKTAANVRSDTHIWQNVLRRLRDG